MVLFRWQNPTQAATLHLVITSPQIPLGCDNLSDFSYFWWPGRFWGVRYFVKCPSTRIPLMISSRVVWHFTEVKCHFTSMGIAIIMTYFCFFSNLFYSNIADLQCVNFCCSAKWFSYTYVCIHSFSYSFPLWFIIGYWLEFPVLCSRNLLFIHPVYNRSWLLIPNFPSFPSPPPAFPW